MSTSLTDAESTSLTDAERVRATCNTQLEDDPLDILIDDAHRLIEGLFAGAGLDDEQLESIERWYACHLCWAADPYLRITSDRDGSTSVSLEGQDRFLKQAIKLDPTGRLAAHVNESSFKPLLRTAKTTRVPEMIT